MDIAAALIQVEDRLDDELVGMILPRNRATGDTAVDIDFQHVQAAVLRECVVNLARVKEYITQNVGGTLDSSGFDNWLDLMQGLQAGLLMLGKTRAVQCMERVTGHLKTVMQQGGPGLAPQALDRLADAIVSIEYYMETLQAGRSDPWYMLDNAETALAAVDAQPMRDVPVVRGIGETAYRHAGDRLCPDPACGTGRWRRCCRPSKSRRWPMRADPELIALFLEEAREEQVRIIKHLPAWDQDPANEEALVASRRAFHTLKGSGRVVGAMALAEFAWSIENLLNRLLDNTLTRSPSILHALREAIVVLPQLIDHLGGGAAPIADVAALSAPRPCAGGGQGA